MASNNEAALRHLATQVAQLSLDVALQVQAKEEAEAALEQAYEEIGRLRESVPQEGVVVDGD